jgi:MoaA/NifB/PqqE/SkfB family radical SAM enzyme
MENSAAKFAPPRVIAWEVTRRCPLHCRHCRAGAADVPYGNELSTAECLKVLDSLVPFASAATPAHGGPPELMIIWTGGEPMMRPDILELVSRATSLGMRSVMAPCGLLVTPERLAALKAAGVAACSFSVDGPDAAAHDAFRGVPGAFDNVMRAMSAARDVGMPFQMNTTVSTLNVDRLEEFHSLAVSQGAAKLDLFFLVPVGRGKAIADYALSPAATREVLDWAFAKNLSGPIPVKETCCPSAPSHWAQWRRAHNAPPSRPPCGCLGGRGFAFLSHTGDLQTCGFIDVPCGNVRDFGCDFPSLVSAAVNPLGAAGNCRSRAEGR